MKKKLLYLSVALLVVQNSFAWPWRGKSQKKTDASQLAQPVEKKRPVSNVYVRVLIHEQDAIPRDTFVIESKAGFILENPIGDGKKGIWKTDKINLLVKDNVLYVQCKDQHYRRVTRNRLIVSPTSDTIQLNDKSYHGKLTLCVDQAEQRLLIINRLNLDDYIYSVLRTEMLSFWPLEVQKVQAVASRTYALHHMRHVRSGNKKSLYDLKNTNKHQVYRGSHSSKHLLEAVHDTHNLILTHNNNIALTMFDICCGGVIPADMKIREESKPYLFRSNACDYCKHSSSYAWKAPHKLVELEQAIKKHSSKPRECARMGTLTHVSIADKDEAGIVKKIAFHGSKRRVLLSMRDVRACLTRAGMSIPKSYCFTTTKHGTEVIFNGLGFGHNIGLCQIGARELVKRGWDYKKILAFYYPGTSLSRLTG